MKTLLPFLFLYLTLNIQEQNKIIYIVFNDAENTKTAGITHLPSDNNYNVDKLRCPLHFFSAAHILSTGNYYSTFYYANPTKYPDNPVIVKPVSFLDTIEYIDWDVHTKDFTMKEYLNFIEEMDKNDKVYFIDRTEIKDGMMKMYPVKRMKANY